MAKKMIVEIITNLTRENPLINFQYQHDGCEYKHYFVLTPKGNQDLMPTLEISNEVAIELIYYLNKFINIC